MQTKRHKILKPRKKSCVTFLCFLLLFPLLLLLVHAGEAYAYTAAQRPSLQPSDVFFSRDRILRSAKAHIDRANQVGYGYNNTLLGAEYMPLATSTRKFCCVDLVTHVLYTATASKINGRYHSIVETLATQHAFADSNGIVFNTSGVGIFRQQLTAISQLYTRHVAPVDKNHLRLGDIVISGDKNAIYKPTSNDANQHASLVIGKVTPEENAYLQIPNYNPDTSYFISMSSSRGAEWISTDWYNRDWNTGDPNKGYFISNLFRLNNPPVFQDFGGFRIKKTDATTNTGLIGAELDLESPLKDVIRIVMTSAEYLYPKELRPGTYTLTETKAPDGYTLDPTPRTIEIEPDVINSVYWDSPITNAPSEGFVKVTKKDAVTGANVEGAVFELSQSPSFPPSSTMRLMTQADGTTVSQAFGLVAGITVYVREASVPAPYVLDTQVKQVMLKASETAGVLFTNQRAGGRIQILKKSASNQDLLAGAVFEIRDDTDIIVDTMTTDASGVAVSKTLSLGDYTVKEVTPPPGHIPNEAVYPVTLTCKDMHTPVVEVNVTVENEENEVTLQKTDLITGDPVAGASLNVFNSGGDLVRTLATDGNGCAKMRGLPAGTYTFSEAQAPAGYILNEETYTFTIDIAGGVEGVTSITNTPTQLLLCKRDAEDDAVLLEKAVYELYRIRDGEEPERMRFHLDNGLYLARPDGGHESLVTSEFGTFQVLQLPYGDYRLNEIKAPDGYMLNTASYDFALGEETGVVEYSATNRQTEITLRKTDLITGSPVAGAAFEVFNESGVLVRTLTTDENGHAVAHGLPAGTYTFKETVAPVGYSLNGSSHTFTVDELGNVTGVTEVANEPTGILILKVDAHDPHKPLEGAVIDVFNDTGEHVCSAKTDRQGIATLVALPVGAYTYREVSAPDGYALSHETFAFAIDESGKVSGITTFTNESIPPPPQTGEPFPPYAPLFFGLAVIFLSIAFFRKRRKRKT